MKTTKTILILTFLFSTLGTFASWSDWYVDNSASDPVADGTEEHPFSTIQEAVAASLAKQAAFSADTIYIKGTGNPYYGPIEIPNQNAMRLKGYGDLKPEITLTGAVEATTIKSGDNYRNPTYACMPPAQVGLENLIIKNESTSPNLHYAADVQCWVSWEASVTGFPERIRLGILDCSFLASGSNVCLRVRDLDQRHNQELIDANHRSLVTRCFFQGDGDLVHLSAQQKVDLTSNVFYAGESAIYFEGMTNSVYSRLTQDVRVTYNCFFKQGKASLFSGIYPDLLFQNNTCVGVEGTHLAFLQNNLEARGEVNAFRNIFVSGTNVLAFASEDWKDLVSVDENIFFDVAGVGTNQEITDPQFLSEDLASEDFLRPAETSPAGKLGYYLGAVAPVPEPTLIFISLLSALIIFRSGKA